MLLVRPSGSVRHYHTTVRSSGTVKQYHAAVRPSGLVRHRHAACNQMVSTCSRNSLS